MTHVHTMSSTSITEFACDGCALTLRLASQAEAVHVHDTGAVAADGPIIWNHNMVLVPMEYDIWEAHNAIQA